MSNPSSAVGAAQFEAEAAAMPTIPPSRLMFWSIRRELLEFRTIYLGPVAVGALAIVAFIVGAFHRPPEVTYRALAAMDMKNQSLMFQPHTLAALLVLGVSFLIGIFYSVDALYGERRDRSILFWKSLPVSDAMTVMSKAVVGLVVIPIAGWMVTIATQFVILLVGSAVLLAHGQAVASLWMQPWLVTAPLILLYHIVSMHILWYAPIYTWLLLSSAWAPRAPFLWAIVPPLAVELLENLAFHTSHFGHLVLGRLLGVGNEATQQAANVMPMDSISHINVVGFLSDPGLWIGLAAAAAFLFAAARVRRYRGPI